MQEIYFDNSATTKGAPEAIAAAIKVMAEEYGNPSSIHSKGVAAFRLLQQSRQELAQLLAADKKEIYYTSCGSESNNAAIYGAAARLRSGRLIVGATEHPSLLEPAKDLASKGYDLQLLPVNGSGIVDLAVLEQILTKDTLFVGVHYVNNETGAIQPLREIGAVVKQIAPQAHFHIDGVQAFGRLPINLAEWQADSFAVSGHKIHAPKGIGLLWLKNGSKIPPFIRGGGQESGWRSGTENLPSIVALSAAALKITANMEQNAKKMMAVKQTLLTNINQLVAQSFVNGDIEQAAPHILNMSFIGVKSEVLVHYLEQQEIYVSSGSACSSHKNVASHVLTAMGLSNERIASEIRFSFCPDNNIEEAIIVAKALASAVSEIRQMTGYCLGGKK